MANSNTTISSPVRILADLQSVLRCTGDLGYIITHGDINPWAKCKAFAYPAWRFANAAARLTARRSKNCGLVMKDYGSLWSMYSAMVGAGAGAGGWKYDTPSGGTSSPYRCLDFDGYNGDASAPLQLGIYPSPCYKGNLPRLSDEGGAGSADITLTDLQGDGSNSLRFSGYKYHDISGLNIGVAYGHLTLSPDAAYTLGTVDSYSPRNIPHPGNSVQYYVVPFLTDKTFSGSAPSTSGIFIPCPIGMTLWNCYDYFPFRDRGTIKPQGVLSVTLKVEILETISYTTLGVQFSNDGDSWSTAQNIYSSDGTVTRGTVIETNVILRAGYTDPSYFRMVVSGTPDSREWPIQGYVE